MHGPGGVGKTRLLDEAAHRALDAETVADAYWANVENLQAATQWYTALVPERSLLIIIDEPPEPALLRRILEELKASRRTSKWKVIVAVRTPKDPVVDVLRDPRNRLLADELALDPLPVNDSEALATELVEKFLRIPAQDRASAVQALLRASGRFPVWLMLALRLALEGKPLLELPTDPLGLAELYLGEVLAVPTAEVGSKTVREVLGWTALYQPMNIEHEPIAEFVSAQAGITPTALRRVLTRLAERRALRRRGVRGRLFEVAPDPVRDYVLLDWLSYFDSHVGRRLPTERAQQLGGLLVSAVERAPNGPSLPHVPRVVARLGLFEIIAGYSIDVLGPLADRILRAAEAPGASHRMRLLSLVEAMALWRPSFVVKAVRFFRTQPSTTAEEQTLLGTVETTHNDLLLALAWPLYLAGTSATAAGDRREILAELLELVRLEERTSAALPRGLPNDGRRARQLARRLAEERRELRSSYQSEAQDLAEHLADKLHDPEALDASERVAVETLCEVLLSIERQDTWTEGFKFVFARGRIAPHGELSAGRASLLDRLWSIVANSGTHSKNRELAWKLLAHAHHEANRAADEPAWADEVRDDLTKTLRLLEQDSLPLPDAQAAREIWSWHFEFETNPQLKSLADQCEEAYSRHPDASGMRWLTQLDMSAETTDADRVKAVQDVLDAHTSEALEAFLARGLRVLTSLPEHERWRVSLLKSALEELGRRIEATVAKSSAYKVQFSPPGSAEFELRCALLDGLLRALRPEGADFAADLLRDVLGTMPDDAATCEILHALYLNVRPALTLELTAAELDAVLHHIGTTLSLASPPTWALLGHFIGVDARRVIAEVEDRWPSVPMENARNAFQLLIRGLEARLLFKEEPLLGFGNDEWQRVMLLLVRVPDVGALHGNIEWRLNEMRKHFGPLSLSWTVRFLSARVDFAEKVPEPTLLRSERYHALPHRGAFYRLVARATQSVGDEECLRSMFDLLGRSVTTDYWMPDVVAQLDPEGHHAPRLVGEAIAHESNGDALEKWSRFAGAYPENSAAWRGISIAALRAARQLGLDGEAVFGALTGRGVETWSGAPDELHPRWQSAIDLARERRDEESDVDLLGYWEWRLKAAEARLEYERGRLEEERES